MKNFLVIIFFIFWHAMAAQNFSGFYIEPAIGAKVNTTKKSIIPLPLVTDYFSIKASVENKKGTTKYYYVMNGSGNGLYFTLSKRIYPIKMYQRNAAKKIEKYNQLKG